MWPSNPKARLALLYLIGKAKCVSHEILWHPIAAASSPLVSRSHLCIAACAYMCFLRALFDELPTALLVLSLNNMGRWVQKLNSWSPQCIGEADCKEQFNHVPPTIVVAHMREAAAWLKARRCWRATTLGWSIHKENCRLDWAGQAKKSTFHFITMDQLIALVEFSLTCDNVVLAAGEPWRRGGAIPMGGPFSAQSADRHCVWMCKKLASSLRAMGDMTVIDTGIIQWAPRTGDIVALQQFHDNLMVASKGPTPRGAMYTVCKTMESIWGLKVLCPCCDKNPDLVCHDECMSSTVRCMSVSIYVSPSNTLAHAHPNASNAIWQLKFGGPLQSFWATIGRRTTNVFRSALSNALPFVHSWGSFLLSVTAWMQLAFLSGYPTLAVRASAIEAVHRVRAKTHWDFSMSVQWIPYISSHLPQSVSDTISDLLAWLHRHTVWWGCFYASWHIAHTGPARISVQTGRLICLPSKVSSL